MRSNYGLPLSKIESLIAERIARTEERHAAARERGDDDDCHMGLSAWAEGKMLDLLEAERTLAEAGWTAEFPRLERNGVPVPGARLIRTVYGVRWLDPNGKGPGDALFMNNSDGAVGRKGYRIGMERRPAMAVLTGGGHGLGGAVSTYVAVVPHGSTNPAEAL